MGVGNLDAEAHALAADLTFCHNTEPPLHKRSLLNLLRCNIGIIAYVDGKCNSFFRLFPLLRKIIDLTDFTIFS